MTRTTDQSIPSTQVPHAGGNKVRRSSTHDGAKVFRALLATRGQPRETTSAPKTAVASRKERDRSLGTAENQNSGSAVAIASDKVLPTPEVPISRSDSDVSEIDASSSQSDGASPARVETTIPSLSSMPDAAPQLVGNPDLDRGDGSREANNSDAYELGIRQSSDPPGDQTASCAVQIPGQLALDGSIRLQKAEEGLAGSTPTAPLARQLAPAVVALSSTQDGTSQITLHLSPDTLGAVKVTLTRNAVGDTVIVVTAARAETVQALAAERAQLRAMVHESSISRHDAHVQIEFHTGAVAPIPAADTGNTSSPSWDDRRGGHQSRQGTSEQVVNQSVTSDPDNRGGGGEASRQRNDTPNSARRVRRWSAVTDEKPSTVIGPTPRTSQLSAVNPVNITV